MSNLSRKIQALEESETLVLTDRARELQSHGAGVISFTAGEPDFPTPPHVKAAAIEAIQRDFTRYTPAAGIPELREAVCQKLARENGISLEVEQVLISAGAKQSVFNALQAICNPGDEVILFSPYWVSYPPLVRLADAQPVIVKTRRENSYHAEPEAVRRAFSRRTKAIILNSPSNPTGAVLRADEIDFFVRLARERGIYLISDEVYETILFDGRRHLSVGAREEIRNQVITVNSLSKSHAMPGWRIGYMAGPREVIRAATRLQGQVLSCVNSVAQKAGAAALSGPNSGVEEMAREFEHRRDVVRDSLGALPELQTADPEGAIFYFLDCARWLGRSFHGRSLRTARDLCLYLLEERHVGLVPGGAFGEPGALRLSFCRPEGELREGIRRLQEGLQELD
jgi:aspartate aminotransferase